MRNPEAFLGQSLEWKDIQNSPPHESWLPRFRFPFKEAFGPDKYGSLRTGWGQGNPFVLAISIFGMLLSGDDTLWGSGTHIVFEKGDYDLKSSEREWSFDGNFWQMSMCAVSIACRGHVVADGMTQGDVAYLCNVRIVIEWVADKKDLR